MWSPGKPWYALLVLAGIGLSAVLWTRLARRDPRLLVVYVAGLVGAFVGAKVLYLAIDGWRYFGQPDAWMQWATGKTVLGALPGGYLGVELGKRAVGYAAPTGDWFAVVAPLGLALGRAGCWVHGCCGGRRLAAAWWTVQDAAGNSRWPAVPAEMLFNGVMAGLALVWQRRGTLRHQRFHLYLLAYGLFRFGHEFLRSEARLLGPFTGYHFAAVLVGGLGAVAFWRRRQALRSGSPPAAPSSGAL